MRVNGYKIERSANLECANLNGADLRHKDLGPSSLETGRITKAHLPWLLNNVFGTNLKNAKLNGADLRSSVLCFANLQGSTAEAVDFIQADLRGANFSDVKFFNSRFNFSQLDFANFRDAILQIAKMQNYR